MTAFTSIRSVTIALCTNYVSFVNVCLSPQREHTLCEPENGGAWQGQRNGSYRGAEGEGFGARRVAVSDRGWPFLWETPSWKKNQTQQVLISAPSHGDR